jgi:predicted transcriptional regulator
MKTAVSLPDQLFRGAERLARRLKKTRSRLYGEAIAEYLARHDDDALTEAMDRVVAEVGAAPDPALQRAARRVLRRSEW